MAVQTKVRAVGLNPWHTIAYRGVPVFRAHALVMLIAYEHGAPHLVWSGDRRDSVIKRFNKNHGTSLHGQQWLIDAHARDPVHFFPANPVDETSHCLRSDGNPAYKVNGKQIAARGALPKHMLGIDATDFGPHAKQNDCTHLVNTINDLGFAATRPYHAGSEMHHYVLTENPVPRLRALGVFG